MSPPNKTPVESGTAEALLDWLDAFPTERIERRLSALLTQRRSLDVEIRFLQAQLVRYRQYLEDLRPGTLTASEDGRRQNGESDATTGQPQMPPKRLAVLRLLAETPGRAWRLAEVRQALIERGWLEDSDRASHALQVTLLGMAQRGELNKPRTGFYRIPTDETAEQIGMPTMMAAPSGTPSVRQALIMVMRERPGRWSKAEIFEALGRHGWMPEAKNAKNQVTSRLGEMVARGEAIRHKPGIYSLVTSEELRGAPSSGDG